MASWNGLVGLFPKIPRCRDPGLTVQNENLEVVDIITCLADGYHGVGQFSQKETYALSVQGDHA